VRIQVTCQIYIFEGLKKLYRNLHKWGVSGQSSMSTPDFRRSSQKFSKHLSKMGFRGETCPGIHHFMRFYPRKTGVKQRFSCKNPVLSIKNSISNTKLDQYSPFWGFLKSQKHEFVPPKINV